MSQQEQAIYRLTREERELIVSTSEADDTIHVHSTSPTWTRRLLKRGWTGTPTDGGGHEFILPKRALTIRSRKAVLEAKPDPGASEDAGEGDFSDEPAAAGGFGDEGGTVEATETDE